MLALLAVAIAVLCSLAPRESAAKTQVRGVAATLDAGEKLAQRGRYVDAERAFRAVLKHKPDSTRAMHNLGTMLPELGRQAEGLSALRKAAFISPANPSVLYSLGRLQALVDQHASAVDSLRRASLILDDVELPPVNLSTSVLQGLGASLLHLGRYAEALHLSDSVRYLRRPLPARALSNRASALLHLGRIDEALSNWNTAIGRTPQDLGLLALRASALRKVSRGKEAAEDLLVVLREMVEREHKNAELYELTLTDVFDDAAYSLQEWQASAGRSRAQDVLPLWRELLTLLHKVAPPQHIDSTRATGTKEGDAFDNDASAYSLDEETALMRVWNPDWARNKSALAQIRAALAAGRVVQIHSAVNHDLAVALRDELRSTTALARNGGLKFGVDAPIQQRHEASRTQAGAADDAAVQWDDLDELTQQTVYRDALLSSAETKEARAAGDTGAGAIPEGQGRVCGILRAAYNQTFRMRVHGTAPDANGATDGCVEGAGVSLSDWPRADASQVLHDVLHSTAMTLFVSDMLAQLNTGQARVASGERGTKTRANGLRAAANSLVPIVQATSLQQGDYLSPHNDLLAASGSSGSNRRLAFVLHLSHGWGKQCGGAFVWCDPFEVMQPEFNTLTLFPTSHFSWHYVEPVWRSTAGNDSCDDGHRLAWSGWFAALSSHQDSFTNAGGDLISPLGWLRNRIEAYLYQQESAGVLQTGDTSTSRGGALHVGSDTTQNIA